MKDNMFIEGNQIGNIISINNKFMSLNSKRLICLLKKFKNINGIEVFVNYNDKRELKYLEELVYEIKNQDLILQIHGDSTKDLNEQIVFLEKLKQYSNYLNKKIVVTFHSIYDNDKNISIQKTKEYMEKIIKQIDSDNLIFCLENLNNLDGCYRLKKEDLTSILLSNDKINLTYDIGHELVEYNTIKYPDNVFKIKNLHVHECNEGVDHFPIYDSSYNLETIFKCVKYLIKNGYQHNVVFEYDLLSCNGETIENKIIDYLDSIQNILDYYNN